MSKGKKLESFLLGLQTTLEAGVSLAEALSSLKRVKEYSEFARKGLRSLEMGNALADGLRQYLSPVERAILLAGEKSDQLSYAIDRILHLRKASGRAKGALIGAIAYPLFLLLFALGLVMFAGRVLAPAFKEMGINLKGTVFGLYMSFARLEVLLPFALIVVSILVGTVLFSVKALGEYRSKTDRYWPFSVYKFWSGVVFLYVFTMLLKSGYSENQALEEIGRTNRYFRWLTRKYLDRMTSSSVNLGEAMLRTFPIPNEETAYLLQSISSYAGYHEKLPEVAERLLDRFLAKLNTAGKVLNMVMLLLVGLLLMGYALGTYQAMGEAFQALKKGLM